VGGRESELVVRSACLRIVCGKGRVFPSFFDWRRSASPANRSREWGEIA